MRASFLLSLLILVTSSAATFGQDLDGQADLDGLSDFVQSYCLDCHNDADKVGNLDLDGFDVTEIASAGATWDSTHWEKLLRRIQSRQMPPADADRPDEKEYRAAISALVAALDKHAAKHPRPGRTESIRRLTRREYQNAVRDLLAIDVDVQKMLPADESSHGFDNVTVSELSPVLLSRYITAAQHISRIAIGGRQRTPGGVNFRLPADLTQESHIEGLPLGTRGGGLVEHNFEQDGIYEFQLRLTRDRDENIEGLRGKHPIDLLVDRKRVHQFVVEAPSGKNSYEKRDDTMIDANLKVRIAVKAGPHKVAATFPNTSSSLLEIKRQPFDAAYNRHRHPRQNPAIFEISIVGPFDPEGPGATPSRRRIFSDMNSSAPSRERARGIVEKLARRAYRRPVSDRDIDGPMQFFDEHSDGGKKFDAGIEAALAAILVNPSFLLRVEVEPEGTQLGDDYEISDVELASRLSFFLWSSIPDDELLGEAIAGRLRSPDVLERQVVRMLQDPKSESLVDNFASQWLYLRNLDSVTPDLRRFPDFDDNLRNAFRRETELLFESVMREDRNVMTLIASDETFLNERLARHYDIPHVFGSHFRRVKVAPASHRGGILRHGSILTVTSYATRTAPTIRGNWILENILGTPPPPPPPNVPTLKEKNEQVALSFRDRLAQHRANPACASCHDLIDPVGFALDNFDAVGRWREFEDDQTIDVSGILPDGSEVAGVDDLERAILGNPDLFVQALTEKLLVYALGRGIESYDGPAVRNIVRNARDNDYRFSSIVLGIVESTPFQKRTAN